MTQVLAAQRGAGRLRALVAGNVAARLGALAALALATVMVARVGGPALVGAFTLLRVLPGIAGVLGAAGLPGAAPYFLAAQPGDPRLRPTLAALTCMGAVAATAGWLLLTPLLHRLFFSTWGVGLVLAGGIAVFTQLFVAVGKSLLQGGEDLRGANAAIVAEEAAFLPLYAVLLAWPVGEPTTTVVVALVAADIAVALGIAERLRRTGFFRGWARPDVALGREICGYGGRGQLGGLLVLVNMRLDVAILGALAGPAVLGVYAVASKYAELLRLPGLAVTYVLYPSFARRQPGDARARTRSLIAPAAWLNVAAALPLGLAAGLLLPLVYGSAFDAAVAPALILLCGLVGEGVAGLLTAYLYGVGRPGLNSLAIGVGVVVTVVGDLLLIPRYGAVGAAIASALAYLATCAMLLGCFAAVPAAGRASGGARRSIHPVQGSTP
ncbi:MAG TPA: polysaccharide biosynthesis C-terminal domain-containing protein [Pilimelia sp.]|nr:polysaccharide biosynthesis C-terminal domain-containing protein [Pilimelia sp.]